MLGDDGRPIALSTTFVTQSLPGKVDMGHRVLRTHPVSAKLTNEVILELSVKIDGDGEGPAVVARDWLVKEGFVTIPSD